MRLSNNNKKSKITINIVILSLVYIVVYSMGQWAIPFVIGFILAYAFHNPSKKLSLKLKISSTCSAGIIVFSIISFCVFFTTFMIPLIKNAVIILMQKFPRILNSAPEFLNNILQKISSYFGIEKTFDIGAKFRNYLVESTTDLSKYFPQFIDTGMTLVYTIMFLFMTPIITFYLLKDWKKIELSFKVILKKIANKHVIETLSKINKKLGEYIKGQLLVCCTLSILYIILLYFIGVKEYIICGILSGFLSFAPFFGPFIGLLTTIAMSLDVFEFNYQYLITCSIYLIIPFVDSNFITPKLIGKTTGIQPFWLLFSICATVCILGTFGIFISVPMAVILSTICKDFIKRL